VLMAPTEIDSVRKAIIILQALASKQSGMGVSELSESLRMSKGSVYRILQTLKSRGVVSQDGDSRRYLLGPELVPLGHAAAEVFEFRRAAGPVMAELSSGTGLPSYLNVPGNSDVVCLEHVPSLSGIDLYGRAGHTMPYHACPSGLVLLAFGPSERLERVVTRGLDRFARRTIVTREALEAELERVRAQGYAVGFDDLEDGVGSVSAPIFDLRGAVVAALGLAGFSHLLEGRIQALVERVRAAAASISLNRRREADGGSPTIAGGAY
jgi:DNA-binding IclR family transcriptional regulator